MAVLFMWMDAWVHWAKYLGNEWYIRIRWLIVQVLSVVALLIVLIWLSVFMYGSFYYTYMPAVTHTRDVHLHFRSDCESKGQLCSFPSANLSLSRDGHTELLMRGQPYVVVLNLDMPESQTNQYHGMFMVKLQLYTRHGQVVHTSMRSALFYYKSWLYQILETFCYLPMLLTGVSNQKQQLAITFMDTFEEDPYKPTMGAFIEIQSKRIEIYSAVLKIHAKFVGLRYLLYHWPIVSALFGIGTIMFFMAILTVLSWYKFGADTDSQISDSTTRLSVSEKRNRIRALLDRERRGRSRSGSSASFQGIAATGMHHSSSQPNLQHRRSASASFTPARGVDNLTHSASTSHLESLGSELHHAELSLLDRTRASQDSIATTDYEDDIIHDSEKDYSTPSSGSGSRRSEVSGTGIDIRHRNITQ